MRKEKSRKHAKIVLYLVFATNTIYSIQHGFTWPYWIAAVLTAAVLACDILEALDRGRA